MNPRPEQRSEPAANPAFAFLAIAAVGLIAALAWGWPEARRSGAVSLALGVVLSLGAALGGEAIVARARRRHPAMAGRAARWPQVALVPLALAAAAIAWWMRAGAPPVIGPARVAYTLGGGVAALAFGLLVVERGLAASGRRPAARLRAIAFVATVATFGGAVAEILTALGIPYTVVAQHGLALLIAAMAIEQAARAAGRAFLPPPAPEDATGAATSALARLLAGAGRGAAPIRQYIGIDFSRSWALAYARAAVVPLAAGLSALAWTLSGVAIVPVDARAVYERLGAPVRVLHPGAHFILPWPLGRTRPIDFGAVHEIGLGEAASADRTGAEDPAPAAADRLWEQPHPEEIALLVAGTSAARESFQSASADLRVLYRIGASDDDAVRAAYAVAAPRDLVRAASGRAVTAYFAQRTLEASLGANRETMEAVLRGATQDALDAANSGIRVIRVAIEAIHPPAGAASAYHDVRAAEIGALTTVAVEQGAAATVREQSEQYVVEQTTAATAAAAEAVGRARIADIAFAADRAAATDGRSFIFERTLTALATALGKAPKTIVDSRLATEAPTLDLRPFAAALAGTRGDE